MTRIDDLQKKFPTVPRDVILKYETQTVGIRPGGGLDKAGEWRRAFSLGSYHNKGVADGTLKEKVEKSGSSAREGMIYQAPRVMRFRTGVAVELRQDYRSPYTIEEESEGKFAIYQGDDRVDDVFFLREKPREEPEPVTSRGTPLSKIFWLLPRCFYLNLTRYCQYFSTGDSCLFCNFNNAQQDARDAGLEVPITLDLDDVIEAYKIRNSEVRQIEAWLTMGGMAKRGQASNLMLKCVDRLSNATSNKPNFTTNSHLPDRQGMIRLKEAGLNGYNCQIEVMDPVFWPQVCPGKAKHAPFEQWIEAIDNAIDVFGAGNVCVLGNVPGTTLMIPNGHKNLQEVQDFHIEVNKTLIKKGAIPVWIPIWWAEGSKVSKDPANRNKFPPSDYHLGVAAAHHESMMEYGLYKDMNKLMICGLHCQTPYCGDIGMLTLAKDLGEWMSDAVSDEENYVKRFVADVKANKVITFAE